MLSGGPCGSLKLTRSTPPLITPPLHPSFSSTKSVTAILQSLFLTFFMACTAHYAKNSRKISSFAALFFISIQAMLSGGLCVSHHNTGGHTSINYPPSSTPPHFHQKSLLSPSINLHSIQHRLYSTLRQNDPQKSPLWPRNLASLYAPC